MEPALVVEGADFHRQSPSCCMSLALWVRMSPAFAVPYRRLFWWEVQTAVQIHSYNSLAAVLLAAGSVVIVREVEGETRSAMRVRKAGARRPSVVAERTGH